MDIGKEQKKITVEPLEDPVPNRETPEPTPEPEPIPTPQPKPEEEPVKV
jgi:large repetitive protein